MSKPKKSLLACVSAAALVASIGFVQAQSPDEGAYPIVNVNGTTDHGADPRAYPADRLPANNADAAQYDMSATPPAEPAVAVAPSDPSVAVAPDPLMTAAAQSPAIEPAPVDTTAAEPAPAPAPATGSNMTVTDAPETRVDLSPASDPLYNLPESGMRAPRPDRN